MARAGRHGGEGRGGEGGAICGETGSRVTGTGVQEGVHRHQGAHGTGPGAGVGPVASPTPAPTLLFSSLLSPPQLLEDKYKRTFQKLDSIQRNSNKFMIFHIYNLFLRELS